MKNLEKLVLPILVIFILSLLYFSYFAPSDDLGNFSKFDTNSSASLPIIVKIVKDKRITRDSSGEYAFYVIDKDNKEVLVNGLKNLPPGIDDSKTIVLTGHLTRESFHAHGIELRN